MKSHNTDVVLYFLWIWQSAKKGNSSAVDGCEGGCDKSH